MSSHLKLEGDSVDPNEIVLVDAQDFYNKQPAKNAYAFMSRGIQVWSTSGQPLKLAKVVYGPSSSGNKEVADQHAESCTSFTSLQSDKQFKKEGTIVDPKERVIVEFNNVYDRCPDDADCSTITADQALDHLNRCTKVWTLDGQPIKLQDWDDDVVVYGTPPDTSRGCIEFQEHLAGIQSDVGLFKNGDKKSEHGPVEIWSWEEGEPERIRKRLEKKERKREQRRHRKFQGGKPHSNSLPQKELSPGPGQILPQGLSHGHGRGRGRGRRRGRWHRRGRGRGCDRVPFEKN